MLFHDGHVHFVVQGGTKNGFLIVPMYFVLGEDYRLTSSDAKCAYTLIFNAWVIDKNKSIVEKDEVLHVCFGKEADVENGLMSLDIK